jgi:lysophospholipase L1-like esterase
LLSFFGGAFLKAAEESRLARWEPEIAAFEAADLKQAPPQGAILFVGSSSIRLWKTLAADFPDRTVINRGFGGSEISDVVAFVERIVVPYHPKQIVMYCGGNDLNSGKTPERVSADFTTFVEKVRAKLPQVPIAYISSAPNLARWEQVDRVRATNAKIRTFCEQTPGLKFIDVFPHMLGADEKPRPEIFGPDGLHMNEKGYALWRGLVGPYLLK